MATSAAHAGVEWSAPSTPISEIGERACDTAVERGVDAWLRSFVAATVRRYNAQPRRSAIAVDSGVTERVNAHAIIRRACIRAAIAGGTTGAVATFASVATAETQGLAGLVAIPAALVSMGVESVLRLREHVRMTCELGELFGVRFDPDAPADLWALFALAFGVGEHAEVEGNPGGKLVSVARIESQSVAKQLGAKLAGESVMRNVVPFLDVASSSIINWVLTRRLGDTARRYARYRRAFDEALAADEELARRLDLLVGGVFFLFTADGHLTAEETALLASLVRRCDPSFRAQLDETLADDIAWLDRLREIPKPSRAAFFYTLEVAAAVDKAASLRERKLLEHAAEALGLPHDEAHVDRMIAELESTGVLTSEGAPWRAAA